MWCDYVKRLLETLDLICAGGRASQVPEEACKIVQGAIGQSKAKQTLHATHTNIDLLGRLYTHGTNIDRLDRL